MTRAGEYAVRCMLIDIVQGAKGGYRLVVPPHKLTLLDVVEAVVGEIFLNDCVMRPASCNRSNACAVHLVWEKARSQLRATLKEATFAGLAGQLPGGSDHPD